MGDKGGNQQHHHHHHHHHKNVHHHHHGHQHSHGHNHNHDHKHDHGHKHGHNHNHNHNHDHKHAHGHKHQHNHDHGHQHKHGHLHGHKHAHVLLHRQLHGHSQIPSKNHGSIYQQGHNDNNNYGINNVQHHINGNSFEQHHPNHQANDHQQDQQHNIQEQNHHVSHHSNPFPSIKQQQYNKYTSNNHQHNNLQFSNYNTKYPDHVPPSYLSTDSNKDNSHNEDHKNVRQEHNFKVHYDESEKGDAQQSHYDHSASNENASYEPKEEYNHNAQDVNSHSSENPPDSSGVKYEESYSSTETDGTSPRFTHDNANKTPLTPQRIKTSSPQKNYNARFRNSNIPNDHDKAHRLKEQEQNSDELSVESQVHYGVRLGQNGYNDYQKKEASISAVTFLQENGEMITVGDDDPFVSVGRQMKLEDANPEESYHGESLESKLSSGRMTLTTAQDYKAAIGKIDEVFNIPLFD